MELQIRKINLTDFPIEIRVGIFKHVKEKHALILRQVSRQFQTDIENFYNFNNTTVHLSYTSGSRTRSRLNLRIKSINIEGSVDPLDVSINLNSFPLPKYPQAVRKLHIFSISSSSILPQTFSTFIQECGQYLKEFYFSISKLKITQCTSSEVFSLQEKTNHACQLRNVETLFISDGEFPENYANNEMKYDKMVMHFLEIPLSMSNLKYLVINLLRSLSPDLYLQIREQIFKIIQHRCETLEKFAFNMFKCLNISNALQTKKVCQFKNPQSAESNRLKINNLKTVSLNFTFFKSSNNKDTLGLSEDDFHFVFINQEKLVVLEIWGLHRLQFSDLMKIVSRNSKTLEVFIVSLKNRNNYKETDQLDISPFALCTKLKTLILIGIGCSMVEIINVDIPKSVTKLHLPGFRNVDRWRNRN